MNALALLALLSTALPPSQTRSTLDLADRTEVRAGNFGFPSDPAVHVETIPSASFTIASRTSSAALGYAPRMGLTDLDEGFNPYYLHNGNLTLAHHWSEVRLTLEELASYGTLNLSTPFLPGSAGTVSSNTFLLRQILYEATTTIFTATLTARRWTWRLALSYSLSGGANEVARLTFPLMITPRAEIGADYGMSHRTHLVTTVWAQHDSLTPPDQDYSIVGGREGVRHHLGPSTELLVAGGASWVYSLVSIPPLTVTGDTGVPLTVFSPNRAGPYVPGALRRAKTLYPTAQAALVFQPAHHDHVEGRVESRLEPAVNRTTGRLSQQVSALVYGRSFWRPWQLGVEGAFAQSLETGINYLTFFSLQASLGYEITRRVLFETGAQLGWQKFGLALNPTIVELAFVAVTIRPATLRF